MRQHICISISLGFKTAGCSAVKNISINLICSWKIIPHLQLLSRLTGNYQTCLMWHQPMQCHCLHKILHEHYTVTLVLNRRKVFSHSTEFITFQSGRSLARPPLPPPPPFYLSSRWPFRKNYMIAKKPSPPTPGSLDTASRSSKSFLFISGAILTGCRGEKRRCQLASWLQQVRHINHLSVYCSPSWS